MCRIAVVLIHGIGEQRPMSTLRSFVSDVLGSPRSKPDKLSESFEVRRLDVRPMDGPDIDCYEFYWAHHMREARFGHLAAWLLRLLRISSKDLNEMSSHLGRGEWYRKAYYMVMILILLALAVAVVLTCTVAWLPQNAVGGFGLCAVLAAALLLVGKLVWQGAETFVLRIVTDAARYLDNTPENIGERQIIRAECVKFLRQLNQSTDPKYDRIIVIGHSLGSVIAYDALKFLWAMQKPHASLPPNVIEKGETTDSDGTLLKLYGRNAIDPPNGPTRQADLQPSIGVSIQSQLFDQLLPYTEWKISHFVTVGSPLTHAPILLTESLEQFWELQKQRELPTSPPRIDDEDARRSCEVLCGWKDKVYFLHHAALFAVVEWSNFYLKGDPIGGPLRPLFGSGVSDVQLVMHPACWSNHTKYWRTRRNPGCEEFKHAIRQIVGLEVTKSVKDGQR